MFSKFSLLEVYLFGWVVILTSFLFYYQHKLNKYEQVEAAFNHVLEKERMKNEIKIELRAADSLNIVNDGVCGDS